MDPYKTAQWRRVRLQVLERDGYVCQIRGPKCKGYATQVDHIVPVEDGGAPFDPANLRAACAWCNSWRAQRQKAMEGWKRASTHIVLVMGPPGACDKLTEHVRQHMGPRDVVIDYHILAEAMGGSAEAVKAARSALLSRLRRGELPAPRVWVTSTNPEARKKFPHHEVVTVDPGAEYALAHMSPEFRHLVHEWYKKTQLVKAREW